MTRSAYPRAIVVVVWTLWLPFGVYAQIRTDNSLGRLAQTLTGPRYLIPQTLGRLAGNNLFYSFQTFNINTGESANFTTVTPTISNVVCRVTGGTPSLINGVLSLTAASGTPGFFFINPSGVTFGAGASIDVPGAFHVSTADYVKFADGNFYADTTKASTFSIAVPEAFGFLGTNRGAIVVRDGASLSTRALQPLSLTASDVEINNGSVFTQGGDIRVVALGQTDREVSLTGPLTSADGNLRILNGGQISSPVIGATDAGNVIVSAGSITIDGQGSRSSRSGIFSTADFGSSGRAGDIQVVATGNLSLVNGGSISSSTFSSGDAGTVSVNSSSITIDGQGTGIYLPWASPFPSTVTGIFSEAKSASGGRAGNVSVTTIGDLSVVNGGLISSSTFASGDAGTVTVNAGSIVIEGIDGGIFSVAARGSRGNAGEVHVTTAGNLSLLFGGVIASSTFSSGNAGSITVNAENITIDNSRDFGSIVDGIYSQADFGSSGRGGDVHVTATGNLSVVNGGSISASTLGPGDAGRVTVNAGSIMIDGGGMQLLSGDLTGIYSVSEGGMGNAGSVEVAAKGDLLVLRGGFISSDTYGLGNAGTVSVNAANITVDGKGNFNTGISSRDAGFGNAGSVNVAASGDLQLLNGGTISSSSSTSFNGNAGTVTVTAASMLLDGSGPAGNSSISASAGGFAGQTGSVTVTALNSITLSNGGEISISNSAVVQRNSTVPNPTLLTVSAPEINVDSGGQITAASSGDFPASDVFVHFGNRFILDSGSISTSANTGNGGSINIQGSGGFLMHNSQVITSVAGLTGNGGDISVNANGLAMNTGFIQANTAAPSATGGNVNINVQSLVPSGNSLFVGGQQPFTFQSDVFGFNVIQAAAPTGVSGTVQVTTPVLDISGALIGLNAKIIDTGGLGRNPCRIEGGSSLVQAGRGGFVPSGRDLLGPPPMEFRKRAGDQAVIAAVDSQLRFGETKCH